MKKLSVTLTTIVVVGLGSLFVNNPVQADTINTKSEIHSEKAEIKANLSKAESELADVMIELDELDKKIEEVEKSLKENQEKMNEIENKIEDKQAEVTALEAEIEKLEAEIKARFEILQDRMVSYQKTGGNIGYMDVIFGSSSFGEFISRVTAVNKITSSDAKLMEEQQKAQDLVKEKQADIEKNLADLNDMKDELKGVKDTILKQKKEAEAEKEKLEGKKQDLQKVKENLEIKDQRMDALEAEISERIALSYMEQQSSDENNNLETLGKKETQDTNQTVSRGSGNLQWPTIGGYVSSNVGMRWGRMHKGMDIARPSNRAILAVDNGVVVEARSSAGFGNKIVIDHQNGMKSIYAHLSSIQVQPGQRVGRGSKIGIMGSTGNSTGVHLHLEIYVNGALKRPSDYF
ncbi:murein hydrolase activator EnvC family protein [Virgibacillus sp. DJP39]|uniref:murein hydrolase activator EnvC family protein n=1 Tax=Virgibacillus sp. DJP39 TaxID=3409790 RepID=UPI003BB57C53